MLRVLIAGGATGIGAATARAFRARGDAVLIADRNEAGLAALRAEGGPGRLETVTADLSDAAAPRAVVDTAARLFGGLDVVFANAGVLLARRLADWTPQDFDLTLAVNLRAPFLLAQAAAPHLARSGRGRIIVTSSTGGLRGHAGMPAYHASKAGLLNLVRALADELGPDGTTVNAVAPGWIETPFNDAFWQHQADPEAARHDLEASIPLRRQGVPEDVAGAVLFLAGPEAAYVTGQTIVVDGGYSAV
ncbi:SDR family NAD(P)-dependent oxidoreductase [Mongoliimonas terrestris]|uniref:SDR family NAD(P)-dependent oxidoreductase n=1 Tax=Mongoliimonas terrestris TaxID=1709001 RepID=UPI000949A63E|nr:SDR family NAD(P)-dependent oxidoreductase [Mongoliimonas terrestris]